MNLAICYTVFNGVELLKGSIDQIIKHVDHVVICYQQVSNLGHENRDIKDQLIYHFSTNSKIRLIEYQPDFDVDTKENERRKHQQMIQFAKGLKASHFILAATDHYYDTEEFIKAKSYIAASRIDVSFTKMYTYYKKPQWQLTPIEDYYMPFIMRLYDYTRISADTNYPYLVDPSVKVNTHYNTHLFDEDEIMLHHYSMIRADIKNKFKNAAASIRWTAGQVEKFISEYENYDIEVNPGITYFRGRKIRVVPNFFDIKI